MKMLNFFTYLNNKIDEFNANKAKGEKKMTDTRAFITDTGSAFVLKTFNDDVIGTYSRRRDAVRGATRRGLVVA